MGCLKVYLVVERFIGEKFESYAGFVCKHPWWYIILPIIINCLLGIGLINLSSDNDVERIYTPRNSQASKDKATLRSIFSDNSGGNFYSQSQIETGIYADVIFQSKTESNILNVDYLLEIESVYIQLLSFTFTDSSGKVSNYSSVCALRTTDCVVDGNIVFTPWFKNHLQTNTIPYPGSGSSSFRGVFGDTRVTSGILQNASSIKLRFHIRHDTDTKRTDGEQWITDFLVKIKDIPTNLTNLFYAHSKSLDEELTANIGGDILYFSLTFTLMIVYATTATANYKCVSDRQNLGRAGVLAAALAILGSFGIVAGCGLEFVSIVGTMPFLIIGIGVDDMFLLLSGLADTYECKSMITPEDRIRKTMRSSGVGVTITSLTDILAFLIGASSPFNSVRNFCVYTGVAVLFCYLNYITFYLGCMVIHERRVFKSRHCCTGQKILPPDKESRNNFLQGQPQSCLCTGSIPSKRSEVEGPLEKYPPKIIARVVLTTPAKILILFGFAAFLGVSIWGATEFQQGLVLTDLVADDSYYYRYSQVNEKHDDSFAISLNIPFIMTYSDSNTWNKIDQLKNAVQNVQGVHPTQWLSWLSAFRNLSSFDNTSETNFITALRNNFLPSAPQFLNDIKFGNLNTTILASRFYVFSNNVQGSSEQGKLMKNIRETVESSVLPNAVAYAPVFVFFEQYIAVLPNTLQTLGIAIAAIFVVTAIFLPHPLLVLFVTLTLAMILVGLFGFMHFWGLTLSSITMIHIIMSVGFSVDFSAHICHGFMESGKANRNEGANGALIKSGGPIFNGAMSSIVGIIMLIFSKSFIFRSFFKVMLLIILFGLGYSLLFLPVMLSLFGPKFDNESKLEQDIKEVNASRPESNKSTRQIPTHPYSNKAFETESTPNETAASLKNLNMLGEGSEGEISKTDYKGKRQLPFPPLKDKR